MIELDASVSRSRSAAQTSAGFWLCIAAIATGAYAIWLLVASPAGNFPLNDDWAYAWSVRHLLDTGELRLSEWISASAIFQVAWGAGFSAAAGAPSFDVLRTSTLVFGVGCPFALAALALRSGLSRPAAAFTALALLANPLFVYLSYTFMSDVFFLGLMIASLACYEDGVERDSWRALLLGSLFAALAYLTRQLGVALPLAVAVVLAARNGRAAWRPVCSAALLPALVFLLHQAWLREVHGLPWGFRLNVVHNGIENLLRASAPVDLYRRFLHGIMYLGVFSLPAFVAVAASGRFDARRARELSSGFLAFCFVLAGPVIYSWAAEGKAMPYLDGVMSRVGIGSIAMAGTKPIVTPSWVFDLVTLVAPFAGAALAALWIDAVLHPRREAGRPGASVLVAAFLMALLTALTVQLWDEYLLVLVPSSLLLVLRESTLTLRGWAAGALVCAAMLAYALIEQADHMAWNGARWKVGRELIEQGVPPEEIQGGFEWVGTYDFEKALPIAIASGYEYDLFAWARVFRDRFYLSFEPQRRTVVVRTATYDTRFGPEGTIYVLERAMPAP